MTQPQSLPELVRLASIAQEANRWQDVVEHLRAAVALAPQHAPLWNELGTALARLDQIDAAADAFQQAATIDPKFLAAQCNLALALLKLDRLDDAHAAYRAALAIDPKSAAAHFGVGTIHERRGEFELARQSYESAIASQPRFVDAHINLGNVLWELGRANEAQAAMQRAVDLDPTSISAARNLGVLYLRAGLTDRAIEQYRRILTIAETTPEAAALHSSLLLAMFYQSPYSPRAHFEEHVRFADRFAKPLRPAVASHGNDPTPDRRLRIGYLSPDFRRHPVATFLEPILANHDRTNFEVHCYSNASRGDEVTARFQKLADVWRDVASLSDDRLAQQIQDDRIDLLIDLSGHTGGNRLGVFARKAAPVQVSYLGYMATTGLTTIDYRITDPHVDPPGLTERFHTEQLLRLPEKFFCYQPPTEGIQATTTPPHRASGQITFASFNMLVKVSESAMRAAWARILLEVKSSRLWLLAPGSRDAAERCLAIFEQQGVDRQRVHMFPRQSYDAYLRTLGEVDIGLDNFPIAGHTTTCDTLWMGTPVVTLAGETYVSRLGVSVLSNVGLPELIAKNVDEYLQLAVDLANDGDRQASTRATLRDRVRERLGDGVRFTGQLEAAYRSIWKTWCESQQ